MTSKLFLSSNRKEEILSSIKNPINSELVTQLSEYVPNLELFTPVEDEESNANIDETDNHDNELNFSDNKNIDNNIYNDVDPNSNGNIEDDDLNIGSETNTGGDNENSNDDSTSTNSNTVVDMTKIIASKLPINLYENVDKIVEKPNSELWVYIKEDINMNNILDETLVSLSSITNLFFNRLVRKQNSMVFTTNE